MQFLAIFLIICAWVVMFGLVLDQAIFFHRHKNYLIFGIDCAVAFILAVAFVKLWLSLGL